MSTAFPANASEIVQSLYYRPSVSVVLKFDPKMQHKAELTHTLKIAVNNVNKLLKQSYASGISALMINKLKLIIDNLNYSTHKKSLAIFLSPVFHKVLYLDFSVRENVYVDEPFTIRDIILRKDEDPEYLLLHLSSTKAAVFLYTQNQFSKIVSDGPESIVEVINDTPEKVSNFTDSSSRKQTILNKFLHRLDHSIHLILNAYNLPLFVLASNKVAGHFKKITKHNNRIVEYVHAKTDDVSLVTLNEIMQPYKDSWKNQKQIHLINIVKAAADAKKLASGMPEVWREAMQNKGKLLVLENNFPYRTPSGSTADVVYMPYDPLDSRTHIRDAVDEMIQKILENGGSVEFIETDMLKDFDHIALVKYY